ncbi:MAG: ABC transporter permease [Acidobacteria bacterium]|nr:ABC transporter permease [Acidobacteriota bacterium]
MGDLSLRFPKLHLFLIRFAGVIVPRSLRADWRQEWEAELRYRETLLAEWDKLDWRNRLDLLRRSLGAFLDALWLQPKRLEDEMFQDLKFGLRMLFKHKSFTVIAVVTLALGIGANTAIFSVVNAVLLRPLSYRDPARLVSFRSNQSVPDVQDIAAWNQTFADIGGNTIAPLDYLSGAEPTQWRAGMVTGTFFRTLGVQPYLGRTITPEDDKPGGAFVVVLSHGLWRDQFGGDKSVIGKTVNLSGNNYEVIGVMPAGFKTPRDDSEAWTPVNVTMKEAAVYRGVHFLRTFARLKPGVGIQQALEDMRTIDKRLAEAFPAESRGRLTTLFPLHDRIVGEFRTPLLVLFGAVGLVLLIACANFANLLLARAATREQELVVRVALGAGRLRLTRQLLTESVLVALLGGLAGVGLAYLGVELLLALKPADVPLLDTVRVDSRVMLFALGVSIATGIFFGLAPAWHALRINVNDSLKEGGRGVAGTSRQRIRLALVVIEIGLALVLLIGAGLLIKSFWHLRSVQPGFNPDNTVTMRIELPEARYKEIPKQSQYRRALLDEVNTLPGVRAALVSEVPLSGDWLTHNFLVEGQQLAEGSEPDVQTISVEGDFFHAMQIPLLSGRDFSAQDQENAPLVGIVNQTLVRQFFSDQNPIGKRVRWARDPNDRWITIVGVAPDVKYFGLNTDTLPALYSPYVQSGRAWKRWMNLVVRGQSDAAALTGAIKERVWKVDPQIPMTRVRSLRDVIGASVEAQRFNMLLLGIFAAVALVLAAVGIYGVMAYAVTQRTHEIGVRVALGAQTNDVLRLVLRQGLWLTLLGVAIGLGGAVALTRVMRTFLFAVSATDPLTFILIPLLLVVVALLACWIPARRATRVDPLTALRCQ